ncbi:MAG: GSCFA domain-containing protein [Chthoniobacterales bacterium]
MALSSTPGTEARNKLRQNRFGRWHRRDEPVDNPQGEFAFQRLRQPFFAPLILPKFKIQRSDNLFAIGSCFARGIEKALLARKMSVLSAAPEFASFATVSKEVTGLGFTNKYNTFSILNELRWALEPEGEFPAESIAELDGGLCYDPHINPTLPLADRSETLRRRSILTEVNSRVASCRVLIITLGLVELWRDTEADLMINTTPPPEAISRYPGRYEFQVSSFSENMRNLEQVHEILSRFGHPDFQVIVTVSPVPLMATFTEQDVVVANTFSKSLLRTVAQEWATAHPNVHYFPSYEMVMNSARDVAWLEDLRHVQGRLVNHIMDAFLEHYVA